MLFAVFYCIQSVANCVAATAAAVAVALMAVSFPLRIELSKAIENYKFKRRHTQTTL